MTFFVPGQLTVRCRQTRHLTGHIRTNFLERRKYGHGIASVARDFSFYVPEMATGRRTLVIAHRLSTVRNAQRIVVLTNSGIEEQGTHEELIAWDGTYANLYHMQLRI